MAQAFREDKQVQNRITESPDHYEKCKKSCRECFTKSKDYNRKLHLFFIGTVREYGYK